MTFLHDVLHDGVQKCTTANECFENKRTLRRDATAAFSFSYVAFLRVHVSSRILAFVIDAVTLKSMSVGKILIKNDVLMHSANCPQVTND